MNFRGTIEGLRKINDGFIYKRILLQKSMKIFFIFLILISLTTSVQSENIKNLEIENISIGDSLLDYLSENEIIEEIKQNKKEAYYYLDDSFGEVYFYSGNFKTYDFLSFFVKPTDSKYIIQSIFGTIQYDENIKKCYEKQNEIDIDLSLNFKNVKKRVGEHLHQVDPSGKSIVKFIYYFFDNNNLLRVECTKFEKNLKKKNGWTDGLSVSLVNNDVQNWFTSY